MDVKLSSVKSTSALMYLNDIECFLKNAIMQIAHLRQVLTLLWEAGVTLKLKKGSFFTEMITYFGHVIRQERLEIS